ncbi:hypothetical protein JCM13591A_18650 [Microbacterium xylanilyticum]
MIAILTNAQRFARSEWLMNGATPGPVTIQASAPGYGSVTFQDVIQVWTGPNYNIGFLNSNVNLNRPGILGGRC